MTQDVNDSPPLVCASTLQQCHVEGLKFERMTWGEECRPTIRLSVRLSRVTKQRRPDATPPTAGAAPTAMEGPSSESDSESERRQFATLP